VFDKTNLPVKDKIAGDVSWADIPTCKSQGLDIEYLMLRGYLHDAGRDPPDQVAFYVDLLKKVRETPEWKALMHDGCVQPDLHERRPSTPSGWRTKRTGIAT